MDMVKLHPFFSLFIGLSCYFILLFKLAFGGNHSKTTVASNFTREDSTRFPNTCSYQPYHYNRDFRVLGSLMATSDKIHRLIIGKVILVHI